MARRLLWVFSECGAGLKEGRDSSSKPPIREVERRGQSFGYPIPKCLELSEMGA